MSRLFNCRIKNKKRKNFPFFIYTLPVLTIGLTLCILFSFKLPNSSVKVASFSTLQRDSWAAERLSYLLPQFPTCGWFKRGKLMLAESLKPQVRNWGIDRAMLSWGVLRVHSSLPLLHCGGSWCSWLAAASLPSPPLVSLFPSGIRWGLKWTLALKSFTPLGWNPS